jgi:hypothetical protein
VKVIVIRISSTTIGTHHKHLSSPCTVVLEMRVKNVFLKIQQMYFKTLPMNLPNYPFVPGVSAIAFLGSLLILTIYFEVLQYFKTDPQEMINFSLPTEGGVCLVSGWDSRFPIVVIIFSRFAGTVLSDEKNLKMLVICSSWLPVDKGPQIGRWNDATMELETASGWVGFRCSPSENQPWSRAIATM